MPRRPSSTLWSATRAETAGEWLAAVTVAWNVWAALRPPGSVAVRVTVASPGATPLTVTSLPDTVARAALGASEAAT